MPLQLSRLHGVKTSSRLELADSAGHAQIDGPKSKSSKWIPINAIESAGNYVEFILKEDTQRILVRKSLSSIEECLTPLGSFASSVVIVNAARICEMRARYTGECDRNAALRQTPDSEPRIRKSSEKIAK